jgi:acetylornithine deacetylase/succinyl-diaminopimelate desuccinylase-like protein
MGVPDPNKRAHSENESRHLGDWVKAIHLYDALARLPRR